MKDSTSANHAILKMRDLTSANHAMLKMTNLSLAGKRIGFAMTGSFCTFDIALECMKNLAAAGAYIMPILSNAAGGTDTKFGKASDIRGEIEKITSVAIVDTIPKAEPIGPGRLLDALLVLPATGNTLAKMAAGIADTPVTMSVKSHLRNDGPVILGVSSNDALGTGAKNIGHLLAAKNIFFVPFGQDAAASKPRSMVFKKEYVLDAVREALEGRQIQPILG